MKLPAEVHGASNPPRAWDQRVGGLTGLPALVRMLGTDPIAVLASAGLAADALDKADNRIAYDAFGRLLEHSSRVTAYAHLGLTAGRMRHLEDLGVVGEIVGHSATVGEALQMLVAYHHLNSGGGVMYTMRHGTIVEVGYGIYYPDITGADQIYDYALASTFNFLRELCGSGWLPSEVLVPHSRRIDAVQFHNLFKVQPQFDSEICALRFSALWLDRRVEGADPEQKRRALLRAHGRGDPDLLQQVYGALRKLLVSGKCSGNDVAYALAMHRRTLNRRLQQRGTTFQHVLDDVRCEVARQLLCYSEVPLDDIAASLGYAGVSPFMRSFRRWTGLTPGRLRQLSATRQADAVPASVSIARRDSPRGPASSRSNAGGGVSAAPGTRNADTRRGRRPTGLVIDGEKSTVSRLAHDYVPIR
jgi:AraC-like DNA-binding protein